MKLIKIYTDFTFTGTTEITFSLLLKDREYIKETFNLICPNYITFYYDKLELFDWLEFYHIFGKRVKEIFLQDYTDKVMVEFVTSKIS